MPAVTITKRQHGSSQTLPLKMQHTLRPFWNDRILRRWLLAWLGAPVLAIVNGAVREFAYKEHVGESAANRISVTPLLALLAVYFWFLQRRWPLGSTRDALSIGAIWVALSMLFEFGFGRYVEGDSWEDLFESYDVRVGNLWILILLWIAAGPATVRTIACEPR